jgi:hypothetical protein
MRVYCLYIFIYRLYARIFIILFYSASVLPILAHSHWLLLVIISYLLLCFGRERFVELDRISSQSLPIGFDTMKNTSLSVPLGNAKGTRVWGNAP